MSRNINDFDRFAASTFRAQSDAVTTLRATAERVRRDPQLAAAVVGIASAERAVAVLEALASELETNN